MILLILIALTAILLGGFLVLTAFEKKRGTRLLAPLRARLDVYAGDVARHVRKLDSGTLKARLRIIGAYLVHEFVHGILIAVRGLERLLTQTVRSLRAHHGVKPSPQGEVGKVE